MPHWLLPHACWPGFNKESRRVTRCFFVPRNHKQKGQEKMITQVSKQYPETWVWCRYLLAPTQRSLKFFWFYLLDTFAFCSSSCFKLKPFLLFIWISSKAPEPTLLLVLFPSMLLFKWQPENYFSNFNTILTLFNLK